MQTTELKAAARRRTKARRARRSREASAVLGQLAATPSADPTALLERLHLTWRSLPSRAEAKLYTSPVGGSAARSDAGSATRRVTPALPTMERRGELPVQHTGRRVQLVDTMSLAAFEKKYAEEDPLMRYVLHVIRTGSAVRRTEIPRGKHAQRKVRPEEDVIFLVLHNSPPCGFRNVYWLTFVDELSVVRNGGESATYVTLSCHGFTLFRSGQGAEFTDLASWVDEKRAFDHMTSMRGLERIQLMLFFFSWKRQTASTRRRRVKARLACSLFTCHPIAAKLLLDVRVVCAEIERESAREYLEPQTSYTLPQLLQVFRARLVSAKAAVAAKTRDICAAIDTTTRELPRHEGGGNSYAVTNYEAFSAALMTSNLRERMFTFLRLVDLHVFEAVFQHLALVVMDVHTLLCGPSGTKNALSQSSAKPLVARENATDSEEFTAMLCLSESGDDTMNPAASRQRVHYAVHTQVQNPETPRSFPGLYVHLEENVNFAGDVGSLALQLAPKKMDVLELVHGVLMDYCVAMDDLPRVLTDERFQYVLTPFVPSLRREFGANLLRVSCLVLEAHAPELRVMRETLETDFRHVGVLQQEHLRCVRAIKVAERETMVDVNGAMRVSLAGERDDEVLPELPDSTTSAAAYELAQKTWGRFVKYANTAAPVLQVGFLLVDQRSLVAKLRAHVSSHVAEMDDALPTIYLQFAQSLLQDVDGRVEKVTKIPTSLADADAWLTQIVAMLPTHTFRQRLDAKCSNLERLRALLKTRGVTSLASTQRDAIRKVDLEWESVYETLMLCLARVQERDSEHRRSFHEVVAKAEEHVATQLQSLVLVFEQLPVDGGDEEALQLTVCDDRKPKRCDSVGKDPGLEIQKRELVQRLEDVVEMDLERKSVTEQFAAYDREYRALLDLPPLQQAAIVAYCSTSNASNENSSLDLTEKLPSELLLQYVVKALELRQWFASWLKLRDKWLDAPLSSVHPGSMLNRIKQFRRRLGYASSKLSRLAVVLLQTLPLERPVQQEDNGGQNLESTASNSFASKDLRLLRVFDDSIEEMVGYSRIFQALSGGAFSEDRWAQTYRLLATERWEVSRENDDLLPRDQLTLRLLCEHCSLEQLAAFLTICDECIVEAKLHVKLEQVRQRMARIEVRVCESNYSVRCEGVPEALVQLDELAVDTKLCLFGQNPELPVCLAVRADLESITTVCEHILSYQKQWRFACEATKLHDVDEFFTKRFSGGEQATSGSKLLSRAGKPPKYGSREEQTLWQAFLDASHAWSDRLRRLFFVSPNSTSANKQETEAVVPDGLQPRLHSATTKTVDATLDGIMSAFEDFDFEANLAACERGMKLVRTYLDSLREKAPRLYCLDDMTLLRLLLRDSDIHQLHRALAICFPRVPLFAVTQSSKRAGSMLASSFLGDGKSGLILLATASRGSNADGTVIIHGLEGMVGNGDVLQQCGHFRLPVAKIGRIRFWFTRLEEEMASMVLTDLKRALNWVMNDSEASLANGYDSLLPQSIATACIMRFTFEMKRALVENVPERLCQGLRQLQATQSRQLGNLAAMRNSSAAACDSRTETILMLSGVQSDVVRHVIELIQLGQLEEARFFWSMQFQARVYMEAAPPPTSNTSTTVVSTPAKPRTSKTDRTEVLPESAEFVDATSDLGQTTGLTVCSQVAHLELCLGQEFVGWGRLVVISPFTQRCCYSLFSALKMHQLALTVPYNSQQAGKAPTALLSSLAQTLMRPHMEFSCCVSAGDPSLRLLSNLLSAAVDLRGFLVLRHWLHLPPRLACTFQDLMVQRYQAATLNSHVSLQHQGATSLVLPRYQGQATGIAAVFIPLESERDLRLGGLLSSIRTQFRAVAVVQPAMSCVAELQLLADGFTRAQIRRTNVIQAFEALKSRELGAACVSDVLSLIPRVVQEARRLRRFHCIVWPSQPSEKKSSRGVTNLKNLVQTHQRVNSRRGPGDNQSLEARESQAFFYHALLAKLEPFLARDEGQFEAARQNVEAALQRVFPLSLGGRLGTKTSGDSREEVVANAVAMYLESAHFSHAEQQLELILKLWRALQTYPAALVHGPPGSGKSTCVVALHRALAALELSEMHENDEDEGNHETAPSESTAQLVILNPKLLTLEQLYGSVAAAGGEVEAGHNASQRPQTRGLRWVLVDGEVDSAVLEHLLGNDGDGRLSASSLPSVILYRSCNRSVLLDSSGALDDASGGLRLLIETTSLSSLSPSAFARCWTLCVSRDCITHTNIISAWCGRWEKQLVFPPKTRGPEAVKLVFRTLDVLVSNVCVRFVVEECAHDPTLSVGAGQPDPKRALRLGCLSLNHMVQIALALVTHWCFRHKTLLLEVSASRLVEIVAFAVLWGFAGHLPESGKHKLEHFMRVQCKDTSDMKHLAELPGNLMDASRFGDLWDELRPMTSALGSRAGTQVSQGPDHLQSTFDPVSGHFLVLSPAAASVVHMCTLMLHSSRSFLLVGPAASGKTSLLRWLVRRNDEEEAAEMKVEASLDHRRIRGILDWMQMPAAWFRPQERDVESGGTSTVRAKMKEESKLFAGRAAHAFVFVDDLAAGGDAQTEFVRTMLDHGLGFSTKQAGFQALEKQVGAGMRLSDGACADAELSPSVARLVRHFAVFRVPVYAPKELLSVFRTKFRHYFSSVDGQKVPSAQPSAGGDRRLPLEEVVLRASVDFATELLALQQQPHTGHPTLFAFNLHLVNLLLERTLKFAAETLASIRRETDPEAATSDGTTLVVLGKVHQSWFSELQTLFLSNCPVTMATKATNAPPTVETSGEEAQKKLWGSLRYLSEKYFSVALRGSGSRDLVLPVSVEAVYFMVQLASRHPQAPLLQPHVTLLRELLASYATSGGTSRRASDQVDNRGAAFNASSPAELIVDVLLEMAAVSSDSASRGGNARVSRARRYADGQLLVLETRIALSTSWGLTQSLHLIHALDQQEQVVLSTSSCYNRAVAERLLQFACDLHGFKVLALDGDGNTVSDPSAAETQKAATIRSAISAAGVRQERIALWVRREQIQGPIRGRWLEDMTRELCLNKLPSLTLLSGGEELRDTLVLSCIQARTQLQVVTENELLAEFQRRLQRNLRICVFEDEDDDNIECEARGQEVQSSVVDWMKTRPSCHWRRVSLSECDSQRLMAEMAKVTLTSPALCGATLQPEQTATHIAMCQRVHDLLMVASTPVDPATQIEFFQSFLTNLVVTYRSQSKRRRMRLVRLESALETLAFACEKVVPAMAQQREAFEIHLAQLEGRLENLSPYRRRTASDSGEQGDSDGDTPLEGTQSHTEATPEEQAEAAWVLRARCEELEMAGYETRLRLQLVSRHLLEWQLVANRANELCVDWTRKLEVEKACGEQSALLRSAVLASAQRAYAHVTALAPGDRALCLKKLQELVYGEDNVRGDAETPYLTLNNDVEDGSDDVDLVRMIWSTRFPFLRDEGLYRVVQLADELCDRVPVVMDASGICQRFFVHFFSGHSLFSSLPGCGSSGGKDENDALSSSNSAQAMVIACEDPALERQLQEAQRLGVPVLLVNFRPDTKLLARLQPFLVHPKRSHAPSRRPLLRELTLLSYEAHRKYRQRRSSAVGSVLAVAASLLPGMTSNPGMSPNARRGLGLKIPNDTPGAPAQSSIDASSTAAASNPTAYATPGERKESSSRQESSLGRSESSDSTSNAGGFQLYAVTSTVVVPQQQYALAAQFAFFSVTPPEAELESFFLSPWVSQPQQTPSTLPQDLRGEELTLLSHGSKLLQNRNHLWELLEVSKPIAVDPNASPFAFQASKHSNGRTLQQQEVFSKLAVHLGLEHQASLAYHSRKRHLESKRSQLQVSLMPFMPAARRLTGVARCLTAMTPLVLGDIAASVFYPQNYRWLESATTQHIVSQSEGNSRLEPEKLQNATFAVLLEHVLAGLVSKSHRQVFCLLVELQNQMHTRDSGRRGSLGTDSENAKRWGEAVSWLLDGGTCTASFCDPVASEQFTQAETMSGPSTKVHRSLPERQGSSKWVVATGVSLVERLRRRVRLSAYLFNGWRPSRGGTRPGRKARELDPEQTCRPSGERLLPRESLAGATIASTINVASDAGFGVETTMDANIARLQEAFDDLLADAEAFWHRWKATKAQEKTDMDRHLASFGVQRVETHRRSTRMSESHAVCGPVQTLLSLDDVCAGFKAIDSASMVSSRRAGSDEGLARLVLAKVFTPHQFANALKGFLDHCKNGSEIHRPYEEGDARHLFLQHTTDAWSTWPSPASLVADIAPSRGRQTRTHLPRALLVYAAETRDTMALRLSTWELVVFWGFETESSAVREQLAALIMAKSRFVLEVLKSEHVEPAIALVSRLINEHALLSVPEWYLLASLSVATAVTSGKLPVLERIVTLDSSTLGDNVLMHAVQHKLTDQGQVSESMASQLVLAVSARDGGSCGSSSPLLQGGSIVRALQDLVPHCLSIEDTATNESEREDMQHRFLRLVTERASGRTPVSETQGGVDAALSDSLLNDLWVVGRLVGQLMPRGCDHDGVWSPQRLSGVEDTARDRLGVVFDRLHGLLRSLQDATSTGNAGGDPSSSVVAQFFPWQTLHDELATQLSAFKALDDRLASLRVHRRQKQCEQGTPQSLASLARGYLPFEWADLFFSGSPWPTAANGTVVLAQFVLLVTCRAGALVRCLRGDRAWALNLAVVSNACIFLRGLRAHAAAQCGVPESAMELVLETDEYSGRLGVNASDAKEGEEQVRDGVLRSNQDDPEAHDDGHGAVLRPSDEAEGASWGIRVEALVLIEQQICPNTAAASATVTKKTKLHSLPVCRFLCQPRVQNAERNYSPVLLLPSLSCYQPTPTWTSVDNESTSVCVVLGKSVLSAVDVDDAVLRTGARCRTHLAVGVPMFPDDEDGGSS